MRPGPLLSSAAPGSPGALRQPEHEVPLPCRPLLPIYIVIFLGLIYLVGIRPQQKRRRELESLMTRLTAGDEVVTVSGIYGTVTEIEDGETVLLEIAEDTDIRIAKGSIARIAQIAPARPPRPTPRRPGREQLAPRDAGEAPPPPAGGGDRPGRGVARGHRAAAGGARARPPGRRRGLLQGEATEDAQVTPEAIDRSVEIIRNRVRLVRRGRAGDPDAGQRPDRGRAAGRGQPGTGRQRPHPAGPARVHQLRGERRRPGGHPEAERRDRARQPHAPKGTRPGARRPSTRWTRTATTCSAPRRTGSPWPRTSRATRSRRA